MAKLEQSDKNTELSEYIFETRHPMLKEKDAKGKGKSVWRLIYDCYVGGLTFRNGEYLIQYPKESLQSFSKRKERSVYFNQVSPIADMLSGLLFLNTPKRKTPPDLDYFTNKTTKTKNIDAAMRLIAAYSLMFTCGILVDSPDFDPDIIRTKRDRDKNKINPYSKIYLPFDIRDFDIDDNGEINWVLLDDSYYDHTDPYSEGQKIQRYRLWTKEFYRDFTRKTLPDGKQYTDISDEIPHPVGYTPFKLVTWRDDDGDYIAETIFEDIAYISRLIYNSMSYMDEMLASGTFKMLAYPSEDGKIPPQITEGGMGPLGALPYQKDSTHAPSFIGAELGEIDAFIKAMEFYMAEILKKVGLSTDETKEFVKSGVAKKIDYEKMRGLLVSGAMIMAETEIWMYATASAWEGKLDSEINSEYTTDFSTEQLREEITMLNEALAYPVTSIKKNVLKVLVKKLLSNNLSPEIIEEINSDIDTSITRVDTNIDKRLVTEPGMTNSGMVNTEKVNDKAVQ